MKAILGLCKQRSPQIDCHSCSYITNDHVSIVRGGVGEWVGKDAKRALLVKIDLCQYIRVRAMSLASIEMEGNRHGSNFEISVLPVTQGSARPSKFGSPLSCFHTPHESAM